MSSLAHSAHPPTYSTTSAQYHHRQRKKKHCTLVDLRPLLLEGSYRIAEHARQHAQCEGFTEHDIIQVSLNGHELMRYPHDKRLLVLGYIEVSASVTIPLHVVLEYGSKPWVDVVTAFIPKHPHRVISRTRLAEVLRHDRHVVMRKASGAKEPQARAPQRDKKRNGSAKISGRWAEKKSK